MVIHELAVAFAVAAAVSGANTEPTAMRPTGYSCDQECHPADPFCRAYQNLFCPPKIPDGFSGSTSAPAVKHED